MNKKFVIISIAIFIALFIASFFWIKFTTNGGSTLLLLVVSLVVTFFLIFILAFFYSIYDLYIKGFKGFKFSNFFEGSLSILKLFPIAIFWIVFLGSFYALFNYIKEEYSFGASLGLYILIMIAIGLLYFFVINPIAKHLDKNKNTEDKINELEKRIDEIEKDK